jgi:hypothetical protein
VLDSQIPTFPGALAAAGYETVLAGRIHFVGPDQRHGFTRRTIGDVGQPRVPAAGKHPLLGSIPPATTGQSKDAVQTAGPGRTFYMAYDDAVTDSACAFLAECDRLSADKPLALVVGYVLPHCPYICPPELFNYYYSRVSTPQLSPGYLDKLHPAQRDDRQRRGFDGLSDEQARIARAASLRVGRVARPDDLVVAGSVSRRGRGGPRDELARRRPHTARSGRRGTDEERDGPVVERPLVGPRRRAELAGRRPGRMLRLPRGAPQPHAPRRTVEDHSALAAPARSLP